MKGLTRRRLLQGAAASVGAAAAGFGIDSAVSGSHAGTASAPVPLGAQPPGLPGAQHAWVETLARDSDGNPVAPRFARLLFFDLAGRPTPAGARALEASLRTLERTFPWGPGGLLFALGWGAPYFEHALGRSSPVAHARALSSFELPVPDGYDACLHLACDDQARLEAVEAALVHGQPLPGADGPLSLEGVLRRRETRTGFVGSGLPAAHQDVDGIPPGDPVPRQAPLFMGFRSGLLKNQASEQRVTITAGAFAGGTTMQVSYMRLSLSSWYGQLDESERVGLMYAPQVTPAQAARFTTDAPGDPAQIEEAISRYGMVGHAQSSARARRDGMPLIIRRDFDTVDGGQAGVHFVSLQASIEDFVRTREAMNASYAQLQNPGITDTVNNGINSFIFVLRRGNYMLPPRAERSFPLLPGRAAALA